MENGSVTLIASTTENPYFYVYSALLSRSTVFEFKPVCAEELTDALRRALAKMEERLLDIARACGGDVRKGVSAIELLCRAGVPQNGVILLTAGDAAQAAQRSAMRYDRDGDNHYDLLSALQKSIRGSDPDAAVYYLARLLEAGDLLSPSPRRTWGWLIRRRFPLSKHVWTRRCSWGCRRRGCRWPKRRC